MYLAFFSGSSNDRGHIGVRCTPCDTKLGQRNAKLSSNRFQPVHFSKCVVNEGPVSQVLGRETKHSPQDHFQTNIHQVEKCLRMGRLLQTFRLNGMEERHKQNKHR
jgi:hypothetical protein